MEILPEIIEVSERMIDTLEENAFFEDSPFLSVDILKKNLQNQMQLKYHSENEDFILTDSEFLQCVNNSISECVSDTLTDLVDKGAINMGIDTDGEIVYSANKDFNPDDL